MPASLSLLLPSLAAVLTDRLQARGLPPCRPAELLAQGDGKVPAEPTAPGQHRPLALDAAGGCAYVRRAGDLELERVLEGTCATRRVTATIPLRLVVVADLDQFPCRDREVGLALGELLLGALETAGVPLAAVGASRGRLLPRRLSTDAETLLTAELGFPVPLPARRGLAAADFVVELTLDPTCLPTCPPHGD